MKTITFKSLSFIPASHEDQESPGALKKVLFTIKDFHPEGKIQMINWAKLPYGKVFACHFHEDMEEVFIISAGKVRIRVGKEIEKLEKGDAVLIPMGVSHQIENIGAEDADYIAIGISLGKGGRTILSKNP